MRITAFWVIGYVVVGLVAAATTKSVMATVCVVLAHMVASLALAWVTHEEVQRAERREKHLAGDRLRIQAPAPGQTDGRAGG